ncbi:unnamed protein product [Ilex paraguariensis]|uniref:Uncharacterized protein n=1 Tax=Ilex paraguariensis TaxID=185542 RepID=A0ABC8S230_9AQUA
MALQTLFSPSILSATPFSCIDSSKNRTTCCAFKPIRCVANTRIVDDHTVPRRSANYIPSVWDYDFVQSLTNDFADEKYIVQADKLKDDVKCLINGVMNQMAKLELIDVIQRLGLKYLFETEIKNGLDIVYKDSNNAGSSDELYAVALKFRLFRQHGYNISQDVFERFIDETNNFKPSLCENVEGLLSLYEASFLGLEGENIIDLAKAFTTRHLKDIIGDISPSLARKVGHALDMPVHWRLTRLEARWFIDAYEQEQNMNPSLLQLAKLDYNMVQSVHQQEVRKLASWWVDIGLHNMAFARDRLVEHYFWNNSMICEPQYGQYRYMTTKITCLITVIDDIYDVYGSVDELELFTDFVDRWDINRIDALPCNIKQCLLALYNTTNEIGYWTLKEKGFNIIPYLRKAWTDICKAYLKEAKWYHGGYKPTLEEYFDNAVVSMATTIMVLGGYFLTTDKITEEALDYIDKLPSIVRCSCMLNRITNDMGTSSDELARGDTLKALQCYMNENGASEEVAREFMNNLINEIWKTLNKDMHKNYPFSEPFLSACANHGRAAQCFYQQGDGHGVPDRWTKDYLISLLVQPIPLN